tara:strand:+ start:1880 stop:2071 length:192 start_codon:yes stop_codon:yes gene_type:complete
MGKGWGTLGGVARGLPKKTGGATVEADVLSLLKQMFLLSKYLTSPCHPGSAARRAATALEERK